MNDEYLIYGETLTAIADSIRSVSSVSTTWTPDEMAAYILANLVKPTTRQAAKTYTPGTSNQTIPAGTFLTGAATIAGDADLAVGNIKEGVNIFGKTGTLSGIWGSPDTFFGFTAVKAGSVTVTSALYYTQLTITHSLGVVPKVVMFIPDSALKSASGGSTTDKNLLAVLGLQTTANVSINSNANLTDGEYILATLRSSSTGLNTKGTVLGYGVTKGTIYPNTIGTMTGSSNLGVKITSTTLELGGSEYKIYAGTYKWLVMG